MKTSTNKLEDEFDHIDIKMSPNERQNSLSRTLHTSSSGNLPTHNVKLERPTESVKHLGDYLSSPQMKKPPKPRKHLVCSKDYEKD